MEIGGDGEEDSALKHSKFHKAKREFLRSKSQQSEEEQLTTGKSQVAGLSTIQEAAVAPSGVIAVEPTPGPSSSSSSQALLFEETHHLPSFGPSRYPTYSFGTKEAVTITPTDLQYTRQQSWLSGVSTSSGTSTSASISFSEFQPQPLTPTATPSSEAGFPEVFRFDSTDRERYLCSAISEEEEVFTHETSMLATKGTSSFDSPHIVLDSPTSSGGGSQLTLAEAVEMSSVFGATVTASAGTAGGGTLVGSGSPSLLTPHSHSLASRVHTGLAMLPSTSMEQVSGLFGGIPSSPVSPLTPNTPLSPSPLFSSDQMLQQGFLAELYRRRCHSDSDLPFLPETTSAHQPRDLSMKSAAAQAQQQVVKTQVRSRKPIPHPLTIPTKGGSLESEQSTPQDSPLDLSVRRDRFGSSNSCDSLTSRFLSSLAIPPPSPGSVAVIRGDIASATTRNSVALRYNLDVSPVVEEVPPGTSMAFVCPVCGQMFSLHDRLAKHMASRHKSKPHDPTKNYPCDVCHRSFARSDMLTRHMRLHTGVKPYTCRTCGQVFSRSDHLSTHQRTHTGEKPYKCPQCCYSACRRDMITRHLRTHTRNSSSSSSDPASTTSTPTSTTFSASDSLPSSEELRPIKLEPSFSFLPYPISRPPSSASSLAPDSPSPLSPALNMSGLSVQSPPMFPPKDQ